MTQNYRLYWCKGSQTFRWGTIEWNLTIPMYQVFFLLLTKKGESGKTKRSVTQGHIMLPATLNKHTCFRLYLFLKMSSLHSDFLITAAYR